VIPLRLGMWMYYISTKVHTSTQVPTEVPTRLHNNTHIRQCINRYEVWTCDELFDK